MPGRVRTGPAPIDDSSGDDAGMVTAELATGLPVLVFLMLVGLLAIAAAHDRIRCADEAAALAGAVARGDTAAEASLRPGGSATVDTVTTSETVRVTVSVPIRGLAFLGTHTISETAVAMREPGSVDAP